LPTATVPASFATEPVPIAAASATAELAVPTAVPAPLPATGSFDRLAERHLQRIHARAESVERGLHAAKATRTRHR
jgi:hypothetical protein